MVLFKVVVQPMFVSIGNNWELSVSLSLAFSVVERMLEVYRTSIYRISKEVFESWSRDAGNEHDGSVDGNLKILRTNFRRFDIQSNFDNECESGFEVVKV